jgi:hypothetical protein
MDSSADSFNIRDHDLVVVSEAPSTEIIKFMTMLNSVTTNALNIKDTVRQSSFPSPCKPGRGTREEL